MWMGYMYIVYNNVTTYSYINTNFLRGSSLMDSGLARFIVVVALESSY